VTDDNQHEITAMAQAVGRIEGKLEYLTDSLTGPQGRITMLEEARVRHWWFTIAIAPVLAIIHALARKLGLDL